MSSEKTLSINVHSIQSNMIVLVISVIVLIKHELFFTYNPFAHVDTDN